MAKLEFDIGSKSFSANGATIRVLEELAFSLEDGEFACLIGPSGCGKTTVLNIIAGLDGDYPKSVLS